MQQSEFEYCRRRAEQEASLALVSRNEIAASVHQELAEAYTRRLDLLSSPDAGRRN